MQLKRQPEAGGLQTATLHGHGPISMWCELLRTTRARTSLARARGHQYHAIGIMICMDIYIVILELEHGTG